MSAASLNAGELNAQRKGRAIRPAILISLLERSDAGEALFHPAEPADSLNALFDQVLWSQGFAPLPDEIHFVVHGRESEA
jgi:hypothetical protein